MNRKFYTRRNQNEDTPLQDLDAGVEAGHNNNSGFRKVLISTGTATILTYVYRGADKSLARPGRKQATTTEDFDVHISYL